MTTHTVGEFKAQFSAILDRVRRGETVGVRYGRGRKPVALLVSLDKVAPPAPRRLGIPGGKARFRIKPGFKMTDEELLGL